MLDTYAERWALITGASSGIGEEFARKLAARGMHLVLVARSEEKLQAIAADLDTRHGTRSVILPHDLSDPNQVTQLWQEVEQKEILVELLVNNAGFGITAAIENTSLDRVMEMVRLNIGALTELTERALRPMLERGHGAIINVSSLAGFMPVAYMGAYAASKAYVLHYSEALWAETRDRGVTVMALCPGTTATEFFEVAGSPNWLKKHSSHTPEQVVKMGLKSLEKKKQYKVCGLKNFLRAVGPRIATRKIVVKESMKYFRPPASDAKPADEEPTA